MKLRLLMIPALGSVALYAACSPTVPTTAYTGATVWDGTGAPVVQNATILVQEGRITSLGSAAAPPRGAEVIALDGKFVIPGLINAHGHVSGLWAPDGVTGEIDRIRGDLELFARYGVTTVNSLGDDDPVIEARNSATPTDARARLFAAGLVIADADPEAAGASARTLAAADVDWLKLRVDDNLQTAEKMPWSAVQAVLDVGAQYGIRVATHLFYLEDAKRLLDMGSGMIAHSVRDTDVDEAFLGQLRDSGVCYVPTLTREVSTFVYGSRPSFFDDPFFTAHANAGEVARVSQPDFMARMAASPAAAGYRIALVQAMANLKTVSDAGLPVAMGTDAGPAGRFPGYFEHMELWMMVEAGMTTAEALRSATAVAASCLEATDIGTLEVGKWADFLVLGEDPLADIEATRSLEAVYIAGREVR
ncbi:MAG: amidohydrolase family protein [Gemmatimonadetes bacterium]|nr:amidohydrolase family protein [Gemmatimonadota bacterium]MDA1103521.1 amidohydrolase family protein [Gemmatimonadota bacterium]